jgi:hypothetical protein
MFKTNLILGSALAVPSQEVLTSLPVPERLNFITDVEVAQIVFICSNQLTEVIVI